MYIQRLFITLLVTFLKLESALVVPSDPLDEPHCGFRRTGCLSAPDAATDQTESLIRFKAIMFAHLDNPQHHHTVPDTEHQLIIELANISAWPKELIYCQCNLGACSANAMAFCIRYKSIRNSRDPQNFLTNTERLDPSRLYIYFNARYFEKAAWGSNSTDVDTGASIAGTILAVDKYGCCPEFFKDDPAKPTNILDYKGWEYDVRKFAIQPSPESYRFAYDPSFCGLSTCKEFSNGESKNPYQYVSKYLHYTDIFSKYSKLGWLNPEQKQELINECRAILRRNTPILYGFALDSSYEHHCNGFIPMPNLMTFAATGGHAVAIVGHGKYNKADTHRNYFKFINSWGPSWGDGGYGYLPEEYVSNPNIFSRGGYSINLPKVITTVTVTAAAPKPCSAACCLPAPKVGEKDHDQKDISNELQTVAA